jgi:serine/threonine-protein kinase
MGVVVSAEHVELAARVAIKVLLPHLCGENEAIAQFAREVCAVAKMESEHVARVFDVGTAENGAPFMVMELLEGHDLEGLLHHQGPLPVPLAVEFVLQVCEAMAEAHALGIVHRDIKPSNLFVTRRADGTWCIKVLDFGVSLMTRRPAGRRSSSPAAVAGSPLYMSPEQIESPDDVDSRTDIWSLGVCLYELISGSRPFSGSTLPAIQGAINTQTPVALRTLRPDVPQGIERIVSRCLERHRYHRYRDVAGLALALLPYAPARCAESVERILTTMLGGTRRSCHAGSSAERAAAAQPNAYTVPVAQRAHADSVPPSANDGERSSPPVSSVICRSRTSIIHDAEVLMAKTLRSTPDPSAEPTRQQRGARLPERPVARGFFPQRAAGHRQGRASGRMY